MNETFKIEETCRMCLDNHAVFNIFETKVFHNSIQVVYSDILSEIFSLPTNERDGLPSKVCKKCGIKLTSAFKWKVLAENSHRQLMKHLLPERGWSGLKVEMKIKKEEMEIKEEEKGDMSEGTVEGGGKAEGDTDYDDEDDLPLVSKNQATRAPSRDQLPGKCRRGVPRKASGKEGRATANARKKRLAAGGGVCDVCGKSVKDIRAHVQTHSAERARLHCPDCPRSFLLRASLRSHRRVHHLGCLYYCPLCDKRYKSGSEHRRLRHPPRPPAWSCSLCPRRFVSAARLHAHLLAHSAEPAFPCDVCGKCFKTRALIDKHRRRVHEKERKNICQYCSKGFFSTYDLDIHLRSHTKEKNYECEQCGRKFGTSSILRSHIRWHAGVKKVGCSICHKRFLDKGSLTIHMVSHTKQKTHPCKYCGTLFGRTDHRNRHQRTAHQHTAAPCQQEPSDKPASGH